MPYSVCSSLHGVNLNVKKLSLYIYIYTGPILESWGMRAIFQKKGKKGQSI